MFQIATRNPRWINFSIDNVFRDFDKMLSEWPETQLDCSTHLSLVTDMSYINDDNSCTIEVVAPGYTKNDINVNVTDDLLVVKASAKEKKKCGLSLVGFERSYKLYRKYDVNSVNAVHKDGVLTITLSPKEKTVKEDVRKVEIKYI